MAEPVHDQVERYEREGYVVVSDILAMDEVDALRAEIAAVCRGERGEAKGLQPAPPGTSDAEAISRVLCINHPHKISPFIAERLAHPRIVEVLQRIIGPNVKCVNCVVFNRHPDNLGLSWHQDEFYIPTRDRSLAQVWIALDEATRDKACLRVIPGSHKPGILWPTRDRRDANRFNDSVFETHDFPYTDDDAVFLEVPAGSAIFFNGYLLHGSLPYQAKTGSRRAITFGYMSAESWFPWDWNGMLEKTDDNRDITMICGTDPHAYKGTQDLVHAWVDQRHD
jgi:phytanoyl-CoA hydroxylase